MPVTKKVFIEECYPMVRAQAYKELSFIMNGETDFHNPIVLLRTTREEWAEFKKTRANFILDPPDIEGEILQIRCGHNRIELAMQKGLTEIDAVIYDSLKDAAEECHRQNKWQKQKYGALV